MIYAEKTIIGVDKIVYYCVTDNICETCRHNPTKKWKGYYCGKCEQYNNTVTECCDYEER